MADPVTPPSQEVMGELSVGEMRLLQSLREGSDRVVMEVGHLEVRKQHLIGQLAQLDEQVSRVLASVAKRLNIPEGEAWHVNPDGKVIRSPPRPGQG